MTDQSRRPKIDPPTIYLIHMLVLILVAGVIVLICFPGLYAAFMTNPLLNALILFAVLRGAIYYFQLVLRLFREAKSINPDDASDAASSTSSPEIVGLMAMVLRDRADLIFQPASMSSLVKSLTSGRDDTRGMMFFRVGFPSAVALIGILWGVFSATGSVQQAIEALPTTGQSTPGTWLGDLFKNHIATALQDVGSAFSSLWFGLSGSLMLGYLHVKSRQVQSNINRQVYAELLLHLKKSLDSNRP